MSSATTSAGAAPPALPTPHDTPPLSARTPPDCPSAASSISPEREAADPPPIANADDRGPRVHRPSSMHLKRKRSSSMVPSLAPSGTLTPEEDAEIPAAKKLHTPSSASASPAAIAAHASHVLHTSAHALASLTAFYDASAAAQGALHDAVRVLARTQATGHKIVTCGVGKSGFIAQKLSAMLKSLGIASSFVSAPEACHGDLGDIRGPHRRAFGRRGAGGGWRLDDGGADAVVFVSYSGRTEELLRVRDHLAPEVDLVVISGASAARCALLAPRDYPRRMAGADDGERETPPRDGARVLLPAPIPESEESAFGVATPTTSALVAMAVGDMLALCLAEELFEGNRDRMKAVFERNHPGGAIGERARKAG